jgi:hypothetical protein
MTSSIPPNLTVRANQVIFGDGSNLLSAKQNLYDTRFRKKVRIDGDGFFAKDVTIEGNLTIGGSVISQDSGLPASTYVDYQTGWGLEEWTFAGDTYDRNLDSLIIKIYNIQTNYATISYVNSQIQNSSSKYLVAKDPNTFPQWANPSLNYMNSATTLAGTSDFILRSSGDVVQNLRIQTADTAVGKYLVCADADGKVAWQEFSGTIPVATTITTDMGQTNLYSFQVYDNTYGRYFQFLLNTYSGQNNAVPSGSICLLLGQDVYNAPTCAIATKGYGSEALVMKATTDVANPQGYTRLSGGSTVDDQFIALGQGGISIQPKFNEAVKVSLPYVQQNLSLNYWTKPFSITTLNSPSNEYPSFIVTKQNQSGNLKSIMINPLAWGGNFNGLTDQDGMQMIFADTTQFDANGVSNVFPTTSYHFVIAPWSYKSEGIQFRSSLKAEEDAADPIKSGYTRISACTDITSLLDSPVPATYVMCDRNGITFKCSDNFGTNPATRVVTYGRHYILNKLGAILNDQSTEILYGLFQVGEPSSAVPSNFYGVTTIHDIFRYNLGTRSVGDVLTCTNSSNGQVEWRAPTAVVPNTISNDVTFYGKTKFENQVTITNVAQTYSVGSTGLSMSNNLDVVTNFGNISTSTSPNYDEVQLRNFDPNTYYYCKSNVFKSVGIITIPANYSNRIQFNIPFQLVHQWCFQGEWGDVAADDYDPANVTLHYYVEKIEIQLKNGENIEYSFVETNPYPHESKALGYFKVKYNRKANPEGPNDDKHVMTQYMTFSNPSFQFIPNSSNVSKTFTVSVKHYWSFWYNREGPDKNNIRSHYGDNVSNHYFDDWKIILCQSSNLSFDAYTFEYPEQVYSTVHNEQYQEKRWERDYIDGSGSGLSWGTWYGVLPWGQISLLNNDQIFTDTKLLIGIGHFGSVNVKGDIHTNGIINARGYHARPGLGRQTYDSNWEYADTPSSNGLWNQNIMNFMWTGEKIETWVDYTRIWTASPNYSDYRIKSNISNLRNVLDDILKTNLYTYDISFPPYEAYRKTGLLAHELQENFEDFPNLVQGVKDAVDVEGKIIPQSIDYQELTIILMKAIQELRQQNIILENKINELQLSINNYNRTVYSSRSGYRTSLA